jgi:hypothetical protein
MSYFMCGELGNRKWHRFYGARFRRDGNWRVRHRLARDGPNGYGSTPRLGQMADSPKQHVIKPTLPARTV